MNDFLETLKSRLARSQIRLNETKQKLEEAQAAHTKALQEWGAWVTAYQTEAGIKDISAIMATATSTGTTQEKIADISETQRPEVPELNKTDLIRDTLRRRPTGITPAELWRIVRDQIPNRSYVYSVLGRLKEKEQVVSRRGKYYIRITATKEEQEKQEEVALQ